MTEGRPLPEEVVHSIAPEATEAKAEKSSRIHEALAVLTLEAQEELAALNAQLEASPKKGAERAAVLQAMELYTPFDTPEGRELLETCLAVAMESNGATLEAMGETHHNISEALRGAHCMAITGEMQRQIRETAEKNGFKVKKGNRDQVLGHANITGVIARTRYEEIQQEQEDPSRGRKAVRFVSTSWDTMARALHEGLTAKADYMAGAEDVTKLAAMAFPENMPKTHEAYINGDTAVALEQYFNERAAMRRDARLPTHASTEHLFAQRNRAAEALSVAIIEATDPKQLSEKGGIKQERLNGIAALAASAELMHAAAYEMMAREDAQQQAELDQLKAIVEADGVAKVVTERAARISFAAAIEDGSETSWIDPPMYKHAGRVVMEQGLPRAVTNYEQMEEAIRVQALPKVEAAVMANQVELPADLLKEVRQLPQEKRVATVVENRTDHYLRRDEYETAFDPEGTMYEGGAAVANMLYEAGITSPEQINETIGHIWSTYLTEVSLAQAEAEVLHARGETMSPEARIVQNARSLTKRMRERRDYKRQEAELRAADKEMPEPNRLIQEGALSAAQEEANLIAQDLQLVNKTMLEKKYGVEYTL